MTQLERFSDTARDLDLGQTGTAGSCVWPPAPMASGAEAMDTSAPRHAPTRTRGRPSETDARADAAHQAVRLCLDTLLERLGYTPDEAVELVRRDAAARA